MAAVLYNANEDCEGTPLSHIAYWLHTDTAYKQFCHSVGIFYCCLWSLTLSELLRNINKTLKHYTVDRFSSAIVVV